MRHWRILLALRHRQMSDHSARPSPLETKPAPFPVGSPEPALAPPWGLTAGRSRKAPKHPEPAITAPKEGVCPSHPPIAAGQVYGAPNDTGNAICDR